MKGTSVLYLDEHPVNYNFEKLLHNYFFRVDVLNNVNLLSSKLKKIQPQVLIIDIDVVHYNPYSLIKRTRVKHPFLSIVVYTKLQKVSLLLKYIPLNLQDFILKSEPMVQVKKSLALVIKKSFSSLKVERSIKLNHSLTWYPINKKLTKIKKEIEIELELTQTEKEVFSILVENFNNFTSCEVMIFEIYNITNPTIKNLARFRNLIYRIKANLNLNIEEDID